MMRVTRIETGDGVPTLRVEGRLTDDAVEELHMACTTPARAAAPLRLDVSGLQFVDAPGVDLLHALRRDGAEITGTSAFLDELLRDRADAPASEAALVAKLRCGDAAAYETLVREHGGRLLATARRLVRTEEDARDAVQDAFIAAFRAIDGFNGGSRLSTWLHRIVVNAALMRLRSRRRRREDAIDDLLPRFADDGHFAESPQEHAAAADELLDRRQTRERVRRAIDRLPASYRTVLVLRDIEELDTEETAAALGVTPNTVKTRLHRARLALRTLLVDTPPDDARRARA